MIKPTTVMLYSDSGDTKTTQAYFLIKYINKKTGKKFRIVMSDGGGIAPFIDSGMVGTTVDVFDFSNRQYALADLRKLSMGYWPRWLKDGKMYASYVEGAQEYFRNEDVCMTTPEEWQQIGGYLIEGMTSTGEVLKSHCANQDATNKVGFKGSFHYEEDGFVFGGVDKGHYNIIQKEVYDRHIKGFSTLPMEWLIWTALIGKGEDRQERTTVFGPQLVGNAMTAQIPSWFTHCFHISKEKYMNVKTRLTPDAEGGETEGFVLWFVKHSNGQDGIPYLAKTRLLPELVPKLLEYCPYGFFPVNYTYGLDLFFKLLERINQQYKAEHDLPARTKEEYESYIKSQSI